MKKTEGSAYLLLFVESGPPFCALENTEMPFICQLIAIYVAGDFFFGVAGAVVFANIVRSSLALIRCNFHFDAENVTISALQRFSTYCTVQL